MSGTQCGSGVYFNGGYVAYLSTRCGGVIPVYQGCPAGYAAAMVNQFFSGPNLQTEYSCLKT